MIHMANQLKNPASLTARTLSVDGSGEQIDPEIQAAMATLNAAMKKQIKDSKQKQSRARARGLMAERVCRNKYGPQSASAGVEREAEQKKNQARQLKKTFYT